MKRIRKIKDFILMLLFFVLSLKEKCSYIQSIGAATVGTQPQKRPILRILRTPY